MKRKKHLKSYVFDFLISFDDNFLLYRIIGSGLELLDPEL